MDEIIKAIKEEQQRWYDMKIRRDKILDAERRGHVMGLGRAIRIIQEKQEEMVLIGE